MKAIIILFAISMQIILSRTQNNTIYTTKYDYIDIKEIISNKRILDSYIDCLLDMGFCNAEGKELKMRCGNDNEFQVEVQKNLPDAIQNGCQKCSEKQRESSDTLIQFLISDRPEDWDKLERKYNGNSTAAPDGEMCQTTPTDITI